MLAPERDREHSIGDQLRSLDVGPMEQLRSGLSGFEQVQGDVDDQTVDKALCGNTQLGCIPMLLLIYPTFMLMNHYPTLGTLLAVSLDTTRPPSTSIPRPLRGRPV
jgi:hypothetical protein